MVAFRKSVFSCLVLACSLTSAGGIDVDTAAREKAKAIHEKIQRQPIIFFVAKGGPNACGPGCSEWIAAEGMIDHDAAQRFRDFLATLPRRDLPIFFNSTGGIAGQAMVLGTLLREHRMAVGVGRTLPEGCRQTIATEDACRRVMQSKGEHRARLATGGARCVSGCVDAFVGGSVRLVARDAQLGIHALRRLRLAPMQGAAPGAVDVHGLLKRYMIEMGVDPGLIDAAAEINADRVRFMSRDEIARFGVETRGYYETQWMTYQGALNQFFVLKSITAAWGADSKEYRTSNVRIWCAGSGSGIWFVYQREPLPHEIGVPAVIQVAVGDSEYMLRGSETKGASGPHSVTENAKIFGRLVVESGETRPGSERQSVAVSWEFLRNAMAVPSIKITESFATHGSGSGWSRVVEFSTNGLSKALEPLQKNCGEPKFLDAPAVNFLDMPGVQGGR